MLVESNKTILEEIEGVKIFRSYFDDLVDGLNIKRCEISKEYSEPIVNAIKTFENHCSILKIKQLNSTCMFLFEGLSFEDVKKIIPELDISKL